MKRDKPGIIVRRTVKGLQPVSAMDAESLMAMPVGTEFDLVSRTKRSLPQLRLYWHTLDQVVRATGKWATAKHLSHELKLVCGFKMTIVDWDTGRASVAVDSVAFDEMDAAEFQKYFDAAMAKLAGHLGFDPLAFAVAA